MQQARQKKKQGKKPSRSGIGELMNDLIDRREFPEVKACPLCGSERIELIPKQSKFSLKCLRCGLMLQDRMVLGILIERWNTRHYPAEVQQAMERMKPKKVIPEKVYFAPKNRGAYFIRFLCPTCRGIANRATNREFCNNNGCGQALDWSE